FAGWDTDTSYITSSVNVTALYSINYYTVTWVVNGNVIQTDHNVTYGVTPTYVGTTPTKPSENGIIYIFNGWDPIVAPVTEDVTYNATFENYSLSYSVVYYDYDSSIIDTQTVGYGNAATNPSDPSRAGYTFTGWDTDTSYITSSVNVTALYTINYYTVSWVVNGITVQTDRNVTYGVIPAYVGTTPTKPTENGILYIFNGWDPIVAPVTEDVTYNATFESFALSYSVVYYDYDSSVIDTQTVGYGNAATNPSDPSRDGYTFAGWDTDTSYITSSVNVTALYSINYYTVSWVVNGITVQTTYNLTWGQVPTFNASEPQKSSDSQFTYSFDSWNPIVTPVTEDVSYNAVFSSTLNYYTLVFLDWDDTVIETQTIGYGYSGVSPINPSRIGYNFSGWDNDYTNIVGYTVTKAQYNIKLFTITWISNSLVIETDTNVPYGTYPSYDGEVPTLERDQENTYTFTGWNEEINIVTENKTYYAAFEITINEYILRFLDWDESVIITQVLPYGVGGSAPADPVRYGYTFSAWDKSFDHIYDNLDVYALYQINYYTVNFKVGSSVVETYYLEYGSLVSYAGEVPTKEADLEFTYTFVSWSPLVTTVSEDITYNATFSNTINYYEVTFKDWDLSVLDTQSVPYGTAAVAPTNLNKEGYDFSEWDTNYYFVSENLVVTAIYTIHQYLVVFKDFDGSDILSQYLPYQSVIEAPEHPNSKGEYYYFTSWDKEYDTAVENITITAIYKSEFHYLIDGSDILISEFTRENTFTSIVIPSSIDGYTVKSIMSLSSSTLVNLVVPSSVTSISFGALQDCVNLKTISLPFVGDGKTKTNFGYIFGAWTYNDNYDYTPALTSVAITGNASIIKAYSFYHLSTITSITFSSQISYIENSAFESCTSLEAFDFSLNLTTIGNRAFYQCESLTEADLSSNTINLGVSAFEYCSSLTSFIFPSGVTTVSDYLFKNCSSLNNVSLPSSITSVGISAFEGCSSFTSIVITTSILTIGEKAYANCNLVTSLYLGTNLISIGFGAFMGFDSLVTMTTSIIGDRVVPVEASHFGYIFGAETYLNNQSFVPQGLEILNVIGSISTIGSYAFYQCSSFKIVNLSNSITTINNAAFKGCNSLVTLSIPFIGKSLTDYNNNNLGYIFDGVPTSTLKTLNVNAATVIGNRAFYNCYGLTTINIPSTFTTIGSEAFYNCASLPYFDISDSVTSIGSYAFYRCLSINGITIPSGITVIERDTFYHCDALTNINLPASLVYIRRGAFNACINLQDVILPSSLTVIESDAFSGCSSITSITIPGGVYSIGDHAFSACNKLVTVVIQNGVNNIELSAFSNCTRLETVTMGNSVVSIGNSAFQSDSSLHTVVLSTSLVSIGNTAFLTCTSLNTITLPASLVSIGNTTFYYCTSLTSITIPLGVTSIGSEAFGACSSLSITAYNDSVKTSWNSAWNSSNRPVYWI
ncbi:MAG: leucine-rich repeat protein, partial [Acholeplasmatales bacterium]|nr:leucine-rich repeat protein [Acholeplasmatales bacterium]